ncbi:MAG: tetratricopeptide repeat protein [Methanomassiliicoccales archaeon]|nr:MAG: tetratricopeptide repeat protein [Methanomassiliicoccales archaeon]
MVLGLNDDDQYIEICLCPNCGNFIDEFSVTCSKCKIRLTGDVSEAEKASSGTLAIDSSLFICSNCGAFIGLDASTCGACGAKRTPLMSQIEISSKKEPLHEGEKSGDPELSSPSPDLFLCVNCGAFLGPNAEGCDVCGMQMLESEYTEEEEEVEEIGEEGEEDEIEEIEEVDESEFSQEDMAKELLSNKGALFLCANCGAFIMSEVAECGICGEAVSDIKRQIKDDEVEEVKSDSKLSNSGAIFICNKCGAFMRQDADECIYCKTHVDRGIKFEDKKSTIVKSPSPQVTPPAPKSPKEKSLADRKKKKESEKVIIGKRTKKEIIDDCRRLWRKKAQALRKLGKYTRALNCLNFALKLGPADSNLMLEKADIYYDLRRYKKAAKLYKQLLEFEPGNTSLWNKLGNTLFRMGHSDESILCYEKSLAIDPNNREAIINKGYLLMKQEKYDEAMEYARMIVT